MMRNVVIYLIMLLMIGCGGLKVMRDCAKPEGRQEYICKSLGFWE